MRTIVYIDGYNLYYSLLRGSPYKWLDLVALFRDQVLSIQEALQPHPVKSGVGFFPFTPSRQRRLLEP